jgi:hypothetical protein
LRSGWRDRQAAIIKLRMACSSPRKTPNPTSPF